MSFARTCLSLGNFTGRRCRWLTPMTPMAWTQHRGMCSKPQEVKASAPPTVPANGTSPLGFKVPGHSPSEMDKKILVWTGRYKSVAEIPELVPISMIAAAKDKARVKVCYIMMAGTIAGCILVVIVGKRNKRKHDALLAESSMTKAI